MEKIQPEFMTSLEKVCSTCHGEGFIYRGQPSKAEECDECEGRGIVPNDLGHSVLTFLKRYAPSK